MPRIFEIDFDRERGFTTEQMRALGDYAAVVRFQDSSAG